MDVHRRVLRSQWCMCLSLKTVTRLSLNSIFRPTKGASRSTATRHTREGTLGSPSGRHTIRRRSSHGTEVDFCETVPRRAPRLQTGESSDGGESSQGAHETSQPPSARHPGCREELARAVLLATSRNSRMFALSFLCMKRDKVVSQSFSAG